MVHIRHTKLGKKNASGPKSRQPERGVSKNRAPNALAAAILSARQQKTAGSSASTASVLDFLQHRVEESITESSSGDVDADIPMLLELCHECVAESGGSVALSVLGGLIRNKAARRGLQASLDGPARPLHKLVKAWGGWGGFIRSHAPADFTLVGDVLYHATATNTPSEAADIAVEGMDSRQVGKPLTSKADVNGIALDFNID